ncbi:hypothetical protein ACIBKY_50890 [Nonomuraea sp. NPDC050394]|uniref:hypothetical protein n=1 Tax=Nonomuraea sp. NPDC050394 TaxID=3364363 RepID=UPI0037B7AC8B
MPTYTLDGVPLDHPAGCWRAKVGTKRRPLPGVRAVSLKVPGRSGEIPVHGLDLEATTLPIVVGAYGIRPDGSNGGVEQLETNLEALAAVFGVRHRLMTLTYTTGSIVRVADVTVETTSEIELDPGPARARFTAVVKIPGVFWRDPIPSTWEGSANGASQPVTTFAGATGPITDALLRITGPAVNPTVVDVATGATIRRPSGLLAGERLLIDCAAMRASKATIDTWDLTPGPDVVDVTGDIQATGPGSAFRWLHLTPTIGVGDPFSRVVLVTSSATSTTAASKLEIRGRRAYL